MSSNGDPRLTIQASLQRASNYNRWIGDQARAHIGSRVLDAGCGSGNITNLLLDRDLVVAVDVWDEFVELMQSNFADTQNVAVHQFDLADPAMSAELQRYGAGQRNLRQCARARRGPPSGPLQHRLSAPSGAPIFLLVPAFPVLYGEHDRADHHFPSLYKAFASETVGPLPIEVETAYYLNLPGFFAWLGLVRMMRRQLNEGSIGFYDRLIPGIRRVEDRVKAPFDNRLSPC